jgi:hypothetical protein
MASAIPARFRAENRPPDAAPRGQTITIPTCGLQIREPLA